MWVENPLVLSRVLPETKYPSEKTNINDLFSLYSHHLKNEIVLSPYIVHHREKKSNNIPFDFEKVLKLIQCLDSNKANLHYEISFKVLKLVSFFIITVFFI